MSLQLLLQQIKISVRSNTPPITLIRQVIENNDFHTKRRIDNSKTEAELVFSQERP